MIYIDVNAIYYFLTAHPQYGRRAKELVVRYGDRLATSALTPWLIYVLVRDARAVEAAMRLARLLPLTDEIYATAVSLERPRDFEDRVHYATMKRHRIGTIISNDRDFDGLDVTRIF